MNDLVLACSTVKDGSMRYVGAPNPEEITAHRDAFLASHALTRANSVLVYLVYEGDDYCRYRTVTDEDRGDGMVNEPSYITDGVATNTPGLALFLLLADCIGAVLYDPRKRALMLSHLGRHNLEKQGGTRSVEYMVEQFGSKPEDITVWLSPAAGRESYPLYAFDNKALHDVAIEQLLAAGVKNENIECSPIDTTKDPEYYSHSEFLQGRRETDGRFAVAVQLKQL